MNKRQLIARVQWHMGPGTGREAASAAVQAVLDSLLQASQEEPVHVAGFGTFSLRHSPARQGYDINRRSPITWPAQSRLVFQPAKGLVRELNPP